MGIRVIYSLSRAALNRLKGGLLMPAPRLLSAMIAMIVVSLAGVVHAGPGAAVRSQEYGVFDFPTCLRYALVHSEEFQKSRISIQIYSEDLKDAHAEVLPTLQLITRYYLARTDADNSNRFSVQLLMTNWDPYLALLKIKSNSILVDIGRLSHMDKISENAANVAKTFYRIHVLERLIRARRQTVALQKNKLDYAKSKQGQGGFDDLDVRAFSNQVRGEVVKLNDLERELEQRFGALKVAMGYHPDYVLPLDTRDAANQILNGFNGQGISFADIQGRNLKLKMMAKQEQAQSNSVTGAYVSLVPKPLIIFESVSNQVDRTSGFNLGLGLDYTIWDGFRRVREIKRQKFKAEQLRIDRNMASERLYGDYKRMRSELDGSGEREGFFWEQAKVAEMGEEKALLMYKSGDLPYDQYINKRLDRVEAEINSITNLQNRVDTLIDLATIAGGLDKYNAGIRY
jgi:outer membrane protein TolC